MSKIVDVHIFSPGTQTSAQGVTREFTSGDLQQVADSYNAQIHEAPIRVGHEDNDKVPAWGWVKGVKLKGEDLYAEVEFSPQMGQYVRDGLYKKVSASFYAPESKINPEPGSWSLRHVAMLGAQPPAVKGLKGFAYEETKEGVLDFATAVDINPESVFDEELGPTLDVDQSPLEFLKDQLEEARQEMAKEKEREAEMDAELEAAGVADEVTDERPDSDFAEEDKAPMKKKPSPAKQGEEDADDEEEGEDTVDSKEKKLDPVGKEDSDVDNDGDSDSSDEYLKKRRKAIAENMKEDKADHAESDEEDSVDHAGSCGSKKKNYKEGEEEMEDDKPFSEIQVPEGVDAAQWEAGFKDALDKFYAGVEAGADEVVHEEAEDQTADYLAGVEAGFEFGQVRLNRDLGSAKHDDKCCDNDEVVDGEGPVASKVKKRKTGEPESTVEKENNFEEVKLKKQTREGLRSGKVIDDEEGDEVANAESGKAKSDLKAHGGEDFGRQELGKGDQKSGRKQKGTGKKGEHDEDSFRAKGKAPEEDRDKKGVGKPTNRKGKGADKDVQTVPGTEFKSNGPTKMGSGKAVKSPAVRVLRFSEQQFSELEDRLHQLEAMNQKLVAEKQAAEAKAHRMQLNDFAESLYETGRLTEAMIEQDELVDYMEGLENGTLEFSEGETPATKLMEILAALPQQVEFSEVAGHDPEAVPVENLDPHERALKMVQEQGVDYSEALKQTLFTAE
jgi:hypothetical protein